MKKILLFTIIIILIPIIIIGIDNNEEIVNIIKYGIYTNKVIAVKNTTNNEIIKVPIEEYVIGVVAGEMPISFNDEALKAQAVASRTYALKKKETSKKDYDVTNDTNYQVYLTDDQMKEKWKGNYEKNINKVKNAVLKTKGEVILYNNNLIDAMFFSTSNGYTENSIDVFTSNLPYLVSVDSLWDKTESPVFSSTNSVSEKEFLFNLGLQDNYINITDIKRTKTGRLISLKVNGKTFDSMTIRKIFNLKSTSFTINISNDIVTFNVSGYGHGVGMSQYGANGMAKEGYSYKEILKHYYQGSEIKKIN